MRRVSFTGHIPQVTGTGHSNCAPKQNMFLLKIYIRACLVLLALLRLFLCCFGANIEWPVVVICGMWPVKNTCRNSCNFTFFQHLRPRNRGFLHESGNSLDFDFLESRQKRWYTYIIHTYKLTYIRISEIKLVLMQETQAGHVLDRN